MDVPDATRRGTTMHRCHRFRLPTLTALTLLAVSTPAQTTTRENVASNGVQGTLGAAEPMLSADGRFVAFRSSSPDLVPGDTNGTADIFVRDRIAGVTTRVSVDSSGAQANTNCAQVAISANGRFVVFETAASNLVAGDTNGTTDIFCHDRQTATTTRVSLGAGGQQATSLCQHGSISADGRYVAFHSSDNTLVPGDQCVGTDVFVRDRQLGITTLVSAGFTGGQTFNNRLYPRISADGSTVVFDSTADDLVQNDLNGVRDVFAWSRASGAITLVSLTSAGAQGNAQSLEASVSGTGRYVAFSSAATNFGGGIANSGQFDVFVRDRLTGQTECASMTHTGADADGFAQGGTTTDDGRFVAFWSVATNLVPGDSNGVYDCFLRDRQTATTLRVSVSAAGLQGRNQSTQPFAAAGGRFVAFTSSTTTFVLPDTNGTSDVFVRDLGATSVATAYGTGCRGTSPFVPQAEGIGQPFLGNSGFAIGVAEGFPQQLAILALSLTPASVPYGTCTVLLGGTAVSLPGSFTDLSGFASAAFPIPSAPSLAGVTIRGQYVVFDPNGRFLGFAALSQGLAVTLNLP
jgi:hypothetical protein